MLDRSGALLVYCRREDASEMPTYLYQLDVEVAKILVYTAKTSAVQVPHFPNQVEKS